MAACDFMERAYEQVPVVDVDSIMKDANEKIVFQPVSYTHLDVYKRQVLSDFDFGISGYSVDKNGNSITISSTSVNTTATTGTFTSNAGKVETCLLYTSRCV